MKFFLFVSFFPNLMNALINNLYIPKDPIMFQRHNKEFFPLEMKPIGMLWMSITWYVYTNNIAYVSRSLWMGYHNLTYNIIVLCTSYFITSCPFQFFSGVQYWVYTFAFLRKIIILIKIKKDFHKMSQKYLNN